MYNAGMRILIPIALILVLFSTTEVSSQSCLPDGITFSTQAQIDSFQINYPGCTEIEGDVIIQGSDINNLNGLNVLISIGGSLRIWSNPTLSSLTGLEGLTAIVGDFNIYDNDALTSLTSLEGLTSIGGNLKIDNNGALTNLTGLDNVTSIVGDLWIQENDTLSSLTGLEGLTSIVGDLRISFNTALISLTGLENVASIGGYLEIWNNPTLPSLMGLENLTSIGEHLRIILNFVLTNLTGLDNLTSIGGGLMIGGDYMLGGNPALTSLAGLEGLISIGGDLRIIWNETLTSLSGLDNIDAGSIDNLYIYNNYLLTSCEVQSVCDYLLSPNGSVNIYNNGSACNNPLEVANACGNTLACLPYGNYYLLSQPDIDDFQVNYPGCTEIEGDIHIEGDDITNLNGLNVLTSIGGHLEIKGNDALPSLTGLDNVAWIGGDLVIPYNNALTSLTGLENITSIGGNLNIYGNDALPSLTGLENMTSIGGDLGIKSNDVLSSLAGLDNIDAESMMDLLVFNNSSLSTCEVLSVCEYLISPNGFIDISNNASGCNSQEEVEEACVWIGVPEMTNKTVLSIYPNPAQSEITISGIEGRINEVSIYNRLGQKLIHQIGTSKKLDVSRLVPGMYVVEVVVDNAKVRERLVVR